MTGIRKTFLLCVGAQKCGTTWLYEYLNRHENVKMGFAKEYHIFDALSLQSTEKMFENVRKEGLKQLNELPRSVFTGEDRSRMGANQNIFKLLDFFQDINNYFDYFAGILQTNDAATLTCDITPSYASLQPRIFREIKNGFNLRGVDVKVLFLMRNPVDRIVSACQMNKNILSIYEKDPDNPENVDLDMVHNIMRSRFNSRVYQERGRYDKTIINIERAFSAEEIYFEFFERLFDQERIAKLCEFLGIPPRQAAIDRKVFPSKFKIVVSDDIKREIKTLYGPVYDYICERYSREFVRDLWGEEAI